MSVLHNVGDVLCAVGDTYQAIDIRSVAIREDDLWVNVMGVIRFTYEAVEVARARVMRRMQEFGLVNTESLRIEAAVRPFEEWQDLCLEMRLGGVLRVGDNKFRLRQRPDVSTQSGYLQWSDFPGIRPLDDRLWPAIDINFDVGGISPLADGRHNFGKMVNLIGYADVFEAVNALCELNVSQQSNGHDLSVSIPVFAAIWAVRIDSLDRRVNVEVQRHRRFRDLKAVISLRGESRVVGAPFRERVEISQFLTETEEEGCIVLARGSAQLKDLRPDDWLQVRLVDPGLGEIQRKENSVRMLIPTPERNILLEALRLFCPDTELDDLLVRAYDAKPPRLNESAGFELHVAWLLGLFGYSTVVLGHYEHIVAPHTKVRRATVDILAASQRRRSLLAVACTLNAPKAEDFSTLRYARDILEREVFAETGVRVVPVLFTSATGCPLYDRPEGTLDAVAIMDADGVRKALNLLRTGQEQDFLNFLVNPTLGRLP